MVRLGRASDTGNRPGSPADVNPSAKENLLARIDRKLAKVNLHYAYQIKHGGTPEQKQRTKNELRMLEQEKRAVQNMEPTMPHIARSERRG
jgi:hypothetical protein